MNHGTQVASLSSTSSFGMSGVNSHAVIAHSASPLASPSVKSTHVSNMKYAWCAPALNYFCRTANVKQDGETSELYYHSVFNKSDVAFLYDHSVNGNCILPGAASLEAVHACSRADIFTDFGLIYVINTAFLRPILITKELVLVTKRSVMHGTVRMHASVGHPPAVGVRAKCRILSSIRQKYSFGLARINIFHSIKMCMKIAYSKISSHGSSEGLQVNPAAVDASLHEVAAIVADEDICEACFQKRKVGLELLLLLEYILLLILMKRLVLIPQLLGIEWLLLIAFPDLIMTYSMLSVTKRQ